MREHAQDPVCVLWEEKGCVEAQTPPEHEGTCDNTGEVGMRNTPRQCTQRILMILTFGRGFSSQSGEGGEHVRGVAAR